MKNITKKWENARRTSDKETGCPQSKISLCCNGKQAHTHGLKWEYVKE